MGVQLRVTGAALALALARPTGQRARRYAKQQARFAADRRVVEPHPPALSAHPPPSSPPRISPLAWPDLARTFCRASRASRPSSTFGGVNGAGTIVDMRGFGAAATSNTLVLINGRRLTDIDIAGVDFSAIPARQHRANRDHPRQQRRRAVRRRRGRRRHQYRDQDRPAGSPPSARVEGGFGSFKQREANASASGSAGPLSVSASMATASIPTATASTTSAPAQRGRRPALHGDRGQRLSQHCPPTISISACRARGASTRTPASIELDTDRRGATTPYVCRARRATSLRRRHAACSAPGVELIVDGGSAPQGSDGLFVAVRLRHLRTCVTLTTASLTPRVNINTQLFGAPSKVTTGVDYYNSSLNAKRSVDLSDPPITATT